MKPFLSICCEICLDGFLLKNVINFSVQQKHSHKVAVKKQKLNKKKLCWFSFCKTAFPGAHASLLFFFFSHASLLLIGLNEITPYSYEFYQVYLDRIPLFFYHSIMLLDFGRLLNWKIDQNSSYMILKSRIKKILIQWFLAKLDKEKPIFKCELSSY